LEKLRERAAQELNPQIGRMGAAAPTMAARSSL